jgi:hypothetical protein
VQEAAVAGDAALEADRVEAAHEEYGHDESRAFAVAHHAAKQAGKKEGAA